jgi:hypothetical protein
MEFLVASVTNRSELGGGRALPLVLANVAVAVHLAQHIVAAVERLLRCPDRIIVRRRLGQHREIGRFGQRQVADVLIEIGARRRLDAVGVAAEEDGIEIEFQNLLLGQGGFEAEGKDRLARLAANIIAGVPQQIFGDLLSDRRATLRAAAAQHALLGEIEHGSDQAREIDSVVVEEILVLGREKGMDDERRIFVVAELDPPFARESLDRSAVIAAHVGRKRRLISKQRLRRRQAAREIDPHRGGQRESRREHPCHRAHQSVLPQRIDPLVHPPVEGDEVGQRPGGDVQALELHSDEASSLLGEMRKAS